MKVAEVLEGRRKFWHELEDLCDRFGKRSRRRMPAGVVARFAALYRAVCADLALADAYQLPPATIEYLHGLVARAHNQLYRARSFQFSAWVEEIFVRVPQLLFRDWSLRLAFVLFWGLFVWAGVTAYYSPQFAEDVLTKEQMTQLEAMYSLPPRDREGDTAFGMFGFYIFQNPRIGLLCFAFGLLFGVGGLYMTAFNAVGLGASFGYMARVAEPARGHFYEFVTAHAPFELTAIVLCAAAGMRLGFALIDTGGLTRSASLRRAGEVAMPTVSVAVLMFVVAAVIEACVSPSALPYWAKASVAITTAGMLMFYFVVLGFPRPTKGLGIRDWELGEANQPMDSGKFGDSRRGRTESPKRAQEAAKNPIPQSPIPNPQSLIPNP